MIVDDRGTNLLAVVNRVNFVPRGDVAAVIDPVPGYHNNVSGLQVAETLIYVGRIAFVAGAGDHKSIKQGHQPQEAGEDD